jgi:nucleoside-diphosphate-sugar epimerase
MAGRACILGGTGQIGRAAARALRLDGWEVTVASRRPLPTDDELTGLGVAHVVADRHDADSLAAAVGTGVDLLVDCICFDDADAAMLVDLASDVGSVVMISSLAVYADALGHAFGGPDGDFPRFPPEMDEDQPTVAAGPQTYATNKVAAEQRLLGARVPVTVLRPGAIHGPWNRAAREWWLVKRILDRRPVVVLAERGDSRFQTTSTAAIAEVTRAAALRPARRVLNVADTDAPSALAIARTIAAHLDHEWAEVLLPGSTFGAVGDHPWNVPLPFVVSARRAAAELGHAPVGTYASTVGPALDWLADHADPQAWADWLPGLAAYPDDQFDYAAEDEVIAGLVAPGT